MGEMRPQILARPDQSHDPVGHFVRRGAEPGTFELHHASHPHGPIERAAPSAIVAALDLIIVMIPSLAQPQHAGLATAKRICHKHTPVALPAPPVQTT